ncbi:NADP-dependent fatty aldehyde dehydrogenase [Pirellula sp. SH-Sr6A]|uniref:aldehyde dehydrogenase (NADP(+)) n=1 Tax=Pirellula sp. SH-Sr6A TaxID=1632865 RepID=UPI00078D358F|nr:aldehyde dehydrogenase (NADP(+)) [Pirellula sp. SH-Sr6A]AMV34902.1 NADP-dependent fatty aldehyde dehydrogenase [Pirellula sp. SH-Sr6A]
MEKVLINGQWIDSNTNGSFQATNPMTGESIARTYPLSAWSELDQALAAASQAFKELRSIHPNTIAEFLETFADLIQSDKETLVALAHEETGLPVSPRLGDVELPRTVSQLKQAAAVARTGSWAMPTIDTKANIRSSYEAIGPVCVFGPNNFPFAFNSLAGGDFAAAIAAGNPVIGKANSSHPATTQRFAELALQAIEKTGMPRGLVQLIYRTTHADGEKLVSDPRLAAIGYTGSRHAGLQLKAAADRVGKPFYAELSSVNPVVFLPGALKERGDKLIEEYVTSGLMGAGQFCTNPGLLLMIDSPEARHFVEGVVAKYMQIPPGTLLSKGVESSLVKSIGVLKDAGAELLAGGDKIAGGRCAVANTVLRVSGEAFLLAPSQFQTEAFGNAVLIVVCKDLMEILRAIESLEGNLTGCVYSATDGSDDAMYGPIATEMLQKVGRLLNDKMPTGVAVSPAMNHGGPFPATAHPGFTAVGIPASLIRFAKLTCYDAVRHDRLPHLLQDSNPRKAWRLIDGAWTL